MAKVKIVLHGKLAEHYDKDIFVHAGTIREAITAMMLIDQFNPEKQSKRFMCKIDGCDLAKKLDDPIEKTEIHLHCDHVEDRNFAKGSGDNPYVNIIIGVILIVISVFFLGGIGSEWGVAFFSAGVGLVTGGIMQILNPVDELESDNEQNKSVTRYPNTVESGTPVPIIVGKHKHGGHIFSLNTASRSQKNVNLSALVSDLSEFEGSWVTMHSQLSESSMNSIPSGGYEGRGGGGGLWQNLKNK